MFPMTIQTCRANKGTQAIVATVRGVFARASSTNVYTMPFGRCDVDWHVDRGIVALACVRHDLIRVWPLPVERPWGEARQSCRGNKLACRA